MKWIKKSLVVFFLVLAGMSLQLDWQSFFSKNRVACAFCDESILKLNTFYEGKEASALLTYKPACQGHVLVLPKRHVVRFEDLTDSEMAEIKEIIAKVDRMSQKIYGSTGYLLLEKNGREAGQSVPHVHFHYLPRTFDQSGLWLVVQILLAPILKPLSPEEMVAQTTFLSSEMPR